MDLIFFTNDAGDHVEYVDAAQTGAFIHSVMMSGGTVTKIYHNVRLGQA